MCRSTTYLAWVLARSEGKNWTKKSLCRMLPQTEATEAEKCVQDWLWFSRQANSKTESSSGYITNSSLMSPTRTAVKNSKLKPKKLSVSVTLPSKDPVRGKGWSMMFRSTKSTTEMTGYLGVQTDLGKFADLQIKAVREANQSAPKDLTMYPVLSTDQNTLRQGGT